ncbi:MAG: hypothetical protein SH808_09320 [Saprospiraceae bacterium]|nr:hypothetical protein [Saprospiraceae bacterium]
MRTIHPQYITDDKGKKLSVVLSIEEYNTMLDELEELEDIRLYDEAKSFDDPSTPMDEAFAIVEAIRKKKA